MKLLIVAFILFSGLVYIAMYIISMVLFYVAAALGPVMIPWVLFEPMSFLFDGWVRFVISASLYKVVGLVMIGIFVESGFTPAALAYLAEIAEERAEDRGSVMGVYSVLLAVGQLLGSALAAPFADAQFHGERLGMNGLIVLTGLLCLVALFTVMLLGHAERRHVRLAAV